MNNKRAEESIEADNILDIEMQENDAGAETIRDYLKELLITLWFGGESFSGKRPFGNSGWEYELYEALANAGAIPCEIDPTDGDIISCDSDKANILIYEAIIRL